MLTNLDNLKYNEHVEYSMLLRVAQDLLSYKCTLHFEKGRVNDTFDKVIDKEIERIEREIIKAENAIMKFEKSHS